MLVETGNIIRNQNSFHIFTEAVSTINDHLCNETESSGHKITIKVIPWARKLQFIDQMYPCNNERHYTGVLLLSREKAM